MWELDGDISLDSNHLKEEVEWINETSEYVEIKPTVGAILAASIKQESSDVEQPSNTFLQPYMEVTVKIEDERNFCDDEKLICNIETELPSPEDKQKAPKDIKTCFTPIELNVFRNCFVKLEQLCLYEEQYSCKVCQKKMNSKLSLNAHLLCHTEEKIKRRRNQNKYCKTCRKPIFSDNLKNSVQKEEKLCTCNPLHKEKHNLIKQSKKSTLEKPFECDCGKNFKSYFLLSNHQRIHTGEKPFSCPICNKSFSEVSNLKRHGRIHTGERPYRCTVCKKQFMYKVNLVTHVRIHTQEKPFTCDFCNKQFVHLSDLRKHERIHTGEKPFKCDICKRQYARRYCLVDHLKSHAKSNCTKK